MAKNKTAQTEQSVTWFLNNLADEAKQADSFKLVELMQQASGFEAKMWGPNIVGFGSYHYRYAVGTRVMHLWQRFRQGQRSFPSTCR